MKERLSGERLSGEGWANDPEGANFPDYLKVEDVRVFQVNEFAGTEYKLPVLSF